MHLRTSFLLVTSLLVGCLGVADDDAVDLGRLDDPTTGGKSDSLGLTVPFVVPGATQGIPGRLELRFSTLGRLGVTTRQTGTSSRLQIEARSDGYTRRSWRGQAPFLAVPGSRAGGTTTEYSLLVLNWGPTEARGHLTIELEEAPPPGVEVVFNEPDCDGCADPAGDLRTAIVDAIRGARRSIDFAIYGINDSQVMHALCDAVDAGIRVRIVTENDSLDPANSRSYYSSLFAPETGLAGCGVDIEVVRSNGLMHHKFYVIDGGSDAPLVITGSTNHTTACFDVNHNHMIFIRGSAEVTAAFEAEFEQLWNRCAVDRLDGTEGRCNECTPRCIENRSEEGPFTVGESEVGVYFSPSDDALRVLRGEARSVRMAAPDPACTGAGGSSCVCRPSGSAWQCDYCGLGEDGFGLLEDARHRVLLSMYSATDQCFALGVARAAGRGVTTLAVWDRVRGGSLYERDDFLCAMGVPVLLSAWNNWSAQARNHNKLVVIDDVVFDGSMNLSTSGSTRNNESTLVVRCPRLADRLADYVTAEAALLLELGVELRTPESCRCSDGVDNDGDGLVDADDPDCDTGGPNDRGD